MSRCLKALSFVVLIACGSDAAPDKDAENTQAMPTLGSDDASTPGSTALQADAASPNPGPGVDAATVGTLPTPPVETDAAVPAHPVDTDGAAPTVPPDAGVVVPVLTADQMLEASYSKKFLECSGLSAGTLPADYFIVDDAYARCIANCVLADSCANVGTWFCGGGAANGKGSVNACVNKCPLAPADGFACGNGKTIPHAYVCDLSSQLDCAGEEDEQNCPRDFQCTSGERVPMRLRCDGFAACKDGSDEPAECARCK